MKLSAEQLNRLFILLGALRDGVLTGQDFEALNDLLRNSPEARDYYVDYVYLCSDLCNLQAAIKHSPAKPREQASCGCEADEELVTPPLALDILKELGDYENQADALELPAPETVCEPAPAVHPSRKPAPQVSKLSMISLITSLAALLFILAYPLLFPPPLTGVAFVSDVIDAKWSSSESLEKGVRLAAGADPIQIIKGIVKIRTDNGVHLVLEAPAEFRFTNSDELAMNYGRLFVNVKEASNGFIVQTHKSKIIDIGTQFGVYTDMRGETELHVFEGKTVLIAGLHNRIEQAMDVIAGQARKFGKSLTEVRPIGLSERFFVRDIESKGNVVWRSDKQIHLADVVGGGDGLGTGQINTGINPSNRPNDKPGEMRDRRGDNTYNSVFGNPFIDGVFVPNGKTEQQVTSAGHIFEACPPTSGYFFADILNTPATVMGPTDTSPFSLVLDGIDYGSEDRLCLCLHANSGITFDLNAFRLRFAGSRIVRFSAVVGIVDCAPSESIESAAAFWVLADGQVRYSNTLRRGAAEPVEIELAETDRFLTLVTTDGESLDITLDRNAIGYDWGLFAEPKLILE